MSTVPVLTPSEDQIFDTLYAFLVDVLGTDATNQIIKASQNQTPTLTGTYVVIQPGVKQRTDQGVKVYTLNSGSTTMGVQDVSRGTQYSYQVDCYGPSAPDWADVITTAWRSMWAADYFASGQTIAGAALAATLAPLYADEPTQLTIVNGEQQYEQRFMGRLYLQVHQTIALPQAFFDQAPSATSEPPYAKKIPADLLSVS